ncbi:site-specific integrase [Mycolicibacterium frederiksbergense]|uniref:site-specific integrase n=1 Tax=Mycolicibacterium frederiksbergense TaxID=117567 RepID=UPI00265C1C56|nr:site-specific integrase [Mycolicibacterium frederiksbergense]MDO0975979.1 tyrosine-type recombinase/integrase [Mycolicibacterium frederiksbergense]
MATISKYQVGSGATLYRVRYRTPDHRQTDKRGFKTKRDAEAFAAEVEVSKRRGEYVSPTMGRATVRDLGIEWLAGQRGHLKPNSYRSLDVSWRVHVEPVWGRTPVSGVAYSAVQAWVSGMAQRRGAKVVRAAHAVLYGILENAVRDRRISSNPARGVKLPAITKKPNTYLSAEQLYALADEAGRYGSLVLLLGTAGLRWGEAAGLRVEDIDFLRRKLVVHRNATGGTVETLKGGEHRTLILAQFVVDELAKTVRGRARGALIWPSQTGGYLKSPATHDSWLSGAVARCQAAADRARAAEGEEPTTAVFPRITAHDLRHTAASLSIASGANVKVVQRMLGHKSAAMTLDVYADLFDDDLTAVADRLDESVGKMWARRAISGL